MYVPSESIVVQSSLFDGLKSLTTCIFPLPVPALNRYNKEPGFVSVAFAVQVTTVPIAAGDGADGCNSVVIAAIDDVSNAANRNINVSHAFLTNFLLSISTSLFAPHGL